MMPGEIYWVDYAITDGREQSGLRPAIIVQDDSAFPTQSPLVVTIALTTNLKALRYPATLRIDPTTRNGLSAPSIALIFQIRSVDLSRVLGRIGALDQASLDDDYILLDRLMGR